VTGYGPPDDPSEAPTGQYNYNDYGQQQPEPGSTPWYRTRAALIGLSALVVILLALVIYEIIDLTHSGGSPAPSTSSTTPSSSSATTTESVAPAPTTTQTEAPTTTPETTPAPTTTPPTTSTSIDDEHRRHHHHL
jgi:cytoskeletal protein RodZ